MPVDVLDGVCAGKEQHRRQHARSGSTHALIGAMVALFRVWRERRHVRRQLAVMSERELQDIGICRGEIVHKIGKPFWRM